MRDNFITGYNILRKKENQSIAQSVTKITSHKRNLLTGFHSLSCLKLHSEITLSPQFVSTPLILSISEGLEETT